MRRLAPLLTLVLTLVLPSFLLSGCSSKMVVTPLAPAGVEFEQVPPDSVFQFLGKDRALVGYQPIAHLEFTANYNLNWPDDEGSVEEALLKKAGKLGAHAIIRTSFTEATAVRFTRGAVRNPTPDKAAIKAAVDSGILNPVRPDPGRIPPHGSEPWLVAARSPSDVRALAVASVAVPQDLPIPDSVMTVLTESLYAELESAGYRVYALDALGPDGLPPEPGPEFDAVLYPDVVPVEAHFYGGQADWDGVSRKVGETRSTGARLLSGILTALVQGEHDRDDGYATDNEPSGWVWAISLEVTMENTIGALIYSGRGGIELLEKADFEGGIYIGDPGPEEYEIEELADEELFIRTGRWVKAVRVALAGLGRGA